jgi:nitrogen fixation/metabolism regulation signal transduction histidine kinase
VIAIAIGLFIAKMIANPIKDMLVKVEEVARGNLL